MAANRAVEYRPISSNPPDQNSVRTHDRFLENRGATLDVAFLSRLADPLGMVETVRRVQEEIDLDLLIVGFREAPQVFQKFCGPDRPVGELDPWYGALSDIEGMDGWTSS